MICLDDMAGCGFQQDFGMSPQSMNLLLLMVTVHCRCEHCITSHIHKPVQQPAATASMATATAA
jgi:hypothetical protein